MTTPAKRAPSHLSPEARRLWTQISTEYGVSDSAGQRLLLLACESLDLLRAAERQVKADGLTVRDRYGAIRGHPMLGTIRDAKASMLRSLKDLNMDIIPLHPGPGRPPGR